MDGHPPYPSDTRAKGYRLEIDYERMIQSDTWALASARQRPLILMLLFTAWQQTPCGSLPDSADIIAARIGIDPDQLALDRAIVLRGWSAADDGRLYHPVLTAHVLEMLARKGKETQRKADYRARLKAQSVPQMSHGTDKGQARPSGGSDDTGTGTGKHLNPCANPDGFAEFWAAYPKKRNKGDAEKSWKKLKPDAALLDRILQAIKTASARDDWRKDNGQYIPYPATWLGAKGWEDSAPCTTTEPSAGGNLFRGVL